MRTALSAILSFAGLVLMSAGMTGVMAQPADADGRKVFQNSVTPLAPADTRAQGLIVNSATDRTRRERMEIMFSLDPPQAARQSLEERVAKGETLSLSEIDRTAADAAAADKLVQWLKDQGFRITSVSRDRTSVYARATVATIEKALQVEMVSVTREGRTYPAARNAPSLPKEVGDAVHAIIGLQPYRHARKHAIHLAAAKVEDAPVTSAGSPPPTPQPQIANRPPYLVKEILKAYNASATKLTGKGEKIAILIDTFPVRSDMTAFAKKNGFAFDPKKLELVNVGTGPLPPREGEETLDAQWAGGIAPGATVRVYASGSLQFVDLDRALDRIYADLQTQPSMHQLSISLGLGETYMSQGEVTAQHLKFLKLAAAGVNVFVSSGDAGSNPDETGNSGGPLQAEYESSDPAVVGVGGTALALDPSSGNPRSETAWPGSGGGESMFFARPAWQQGAGITNGGKRLVPDVSLAAEPEHGAYVFFNGEEQQIGGTSWSAPVWAAFCALINEARRNGGKKPLAYLNPLIYPHIGTPAFRDITSGSNGNSQAGPGYDKVTGIGVPDMVELVKALR